MNKFFKNIIALSSLPIPLPVLKLAFSKTIFPFYHTVSDEYLPHIKNLYEYRNTKKFIADLDFLLKFYKPLTINEFCDDFLHKRQRKNTFVLSFDDGLREIYDVIAPILTKKGVPAVFFINSAFVDNRDLFYKYKISLIVDEVRKNPLKIVSISKFFEKNFLLKINNLNDVVSSLSLNIDVIDKVAKLVEVDFKNFLKVVKPYLTTMQIKELKKQGFAIGAHSVNHYEYRFLQFDEQIRQTAESVKFVKDNFNEKLKLFAFPFTDFGVEKRFFDEVNNKQILDLSFGTAGIKDDCIENNIQRIPVENHKSIKKSLKYEYFYYFLRKLVGKQKITRE